MVKSKLSYLGAVLAAALLAALCALIPGQAGATLGAAARALATGPVYSQGSIVDFCLGIGGQDHVYAETGRSAGVPGSCAAGYEQFAAVADPQGLPIPAGQSTDVVTVTNPGTQAGRTGAAVSLALTAVSSQGHPVTSWTLAVQPAGSGLAGINGSGVITGTLGTPGTYTVTVTATDSVATAGSVTFDWVVNS